MPAFTGRPQDLQARGPVAQVNIAVSAAAETALSAAGQTVPTPIPVAALIDTGASVTAISQGIAQQLGLQPVGVLPVSTPSSVNTNMPLYAIRVLLAPNVVFEVTAIEATGLAAQGIGALLGRDVLKQAVFIYIGYANEFTIAI
jgi:predicted aspartyl protease